MIFFMVQRITYLFNCLLILSIFVPCSYAQETTQNPMAPPLHRGAARQMFGSGSLRTPEKTPVYAIGKKHHGVKSTISPDIPRKVILPHSYPIFLDDFGRIAGYPFPFYPPPEVVTNPKSSLRSGFPMSANRGAGMYGGRPEYYGGKPHHGLPARYPFDFGYFAGHGFQQAPPPDYDLNYDRFNKKNQGKFSEDEDPDEIVEPPFLHSCGRGCRRSEFMCVTSCTCINMSYRCDGDVDCEENEDELGCGEINPNSKCDSKESAGNYVRCPRGKCILKDWLCDGDDDCGDFADETHCGVYKNCSTDQFECANGMCIPKTWVCDNDVDCKDYSDEMNCSQTGCSRNEFECGDGTCISLNWKCDKQIDCSDGSDENHCDFKPELCPKGTIQCLKDFCIKESFKCDGDNDCGEWEDETDCDTTPNKCIPGEFKCNNGKCIPDRYRCDKQQDCEENEDEKNCDYTLQKTCSPDEYTCKSGACILKTWVCDGLNDCDQGDDENNCQIVCEESKFACMGADPSDNSTEFCIPKKHVCDGQYDCPKGEDEQNCPTKRDCEKDTKCSQRCVSTGDGKPACACFNGYKLAEDGVTCNDIDECMYATDPVCSQKCSNTIGSFVCNCMTGYVLRPDLRTCKALGGSPTLLFANRIGIRQVSLSNTKYTAIVKGLQNTIALDYHYTKQLLFWTDVSLDIIRCSFINGSGARDVIKAGLESPGGIAVDWIHDLIFWTDSGTRHIEVATLDGKNRAVIAADDVDKPRAIVVHPGKALVFWTDWGPNPKIEKAEMDGSNRKTIVNESVFWPNGLAIDYTSSRIYWADAKHNVIETSMYDGSDRRKVISKGLPHPFAITIFEDAIYWTDWHTKAISTANKATGAGFRNIHSKLNFPMDIHSYHPQRQPSSYRNHCGRNNGGCAHMCVPNKISFTCMCRLGQKLSKDGKNCSKPDKLVFFARKKDLRLKHFDDDNNISPHDIVIPLEGVKSALAIAWDSNTDSIFWTDVTRDTINRASWNGSNQEILIDTNLVSPTGLAYDWITNKIYWTDAGSVKIETSDLLRKHRTLLIWDNLEKPRDIVVDPISGYMYWSDWGSKPKIEKSAMDGSMRSLIARKNLRWPNGLAIDSDAGKLYWTDGGYNTIEMSNTDGTGRQTLVEGKSIPHPFGLDVFEDYVYWTDWSATNMQRANKLNMANRTVIGNKLLGVMDVRIFHRNRKTKDTPCNTDNGGCSHLCLLRPNGHTCACPTGILLGTDKKTCTQGPKNFLIVAHRTEIRQISLDTKHYSDVVLPIKHLKMVSSVDIDRRTGEMFWVDTVEDVIVKSTTDGKHNSVVVMHELMTPDCMVVDSAGRKIYWTDGGRNSLEVCELNGSNRKVLFSKNMDKPRAITIHYSHGLLFWSDWGKNPKIEVAHMDGTDRKTLISKNVFWPNGLAVDKATNRLYWNDGKLGKIESCNLNGRNRKIILNKVDHPYGLVVVGNYMFWTDWKTMAIHRADKTTGADPKIIGGNLEGLMDIRSVQENDVEDNVCGVNNGGCSHLCLRNPTNFTCACPTGILMMENSTTQCMVIPSTYMLIANEYGITRISLDSDEQWDYTLPITGIRNVDDLDFHWKNNTIYYTDLKNSLIRSINMLDYSDIRDIVTTNTTQPDGIAVDWIAENLYWASTGEKKIEAARLDGSNRKVIISERLHNPRSLAVFPRKGFLFWSDWNTIGESKIERSYMDGSSRMTIVDTELKFPVGLTVDYDSRRIYWIDAKPDDEKIETCMFDGRNRVVLAIETTSPFSLTQFKGLIYWTDWKQNSVIQANKTSGKDVKVVRANLEDAFSLTIVSQSRQFGWNPCSENNGGCSHLCFFLGKNYSCECPDASEGDCSTDAQESVSLECPKDRFKCDYPGEEEDDDLLYYFQPNNEDNELPHHDVTTTIYVCISIVAVLAIILGFFVGLLLYLKRLDKLTYARSFSNPNYFSRNEPRGGTKRKQNIYMKYDKAQERVIYEENPIHGSPEITSLIPPIISQSPCNSDFEIVELGKPVHMAHH